MGYVDCVINGEAAFEEYEEILYIVQPNKVFNNFNVK